jgi:CSLREA domain-containing protein
MRLKQPTQTTINHLVRGTWLRLALVSLAALLLVALQQIASTQADAAPQGILFTVTTTADHDDGICNGTDCTLREAIMAANSAPTDDGIDFFVTGVINLTSRLPDITDSMEIQGPGAEMLTVQGQEPGSAGRIFNVTTTGLVIISGLTISKGIPGGTVVFGGGIQSLNGALMSQTALSVTIPMAASPPCLAR